MRKPCHSPAVPPVLSTPSAVAVAVLWACALGAHAQTVPDTSPKLKISPRLAESLGAEAQALAPTFFSGDSVRGRTDLETIIEGRAQVRRFGTVISAERIEYTHAQDRVQARGEVRINRNGNVFEGPLLDLRVEAFEGFITRPTFQFLRNQSHGQADRVEFVGESRAVVKNAWLTTCARNNAASWLPDWVLQAQQIKLDTEADEGEAKNAVVRFKNVPVLAVPTLNFPLSDARRSGWLPPSFNLDNISGFEFTQPYYVNIAPNRDVTLEPTLRTRRGIDVGGEFRYLERDFDGTVRGNVMPHDKLRDTNRWGVATKHNGRLGTPAQGLGQWSVNLDLNRVSDDNYWRDFPRAGSSLTQRLLPADVVLRRTVDSPVGGIGLMARSLRWQTLQDLASPITPPYDRLPQLTADFSRLNWRGFDVRTQADFTRFESDRVRTQQPNANRAYAFAELARTWGGAGWAVTPKAQLHSASYSFDQALVNGSRSHQRTVPTFSLDASAVFERDMAGSRLGLIQTLEPRAFFVRTPYRDQSMLPNYDSGTNDFNFATIYTENAFGGNDRIADASLLTLGATSRFIDSASGAELARLAIAQRLRFSPQRVTLGGAPPIDERVSDLLLGASFNQNQRWTFDSTVQYNQALRQSVRASIGARYSPGPYRVVNAAYRLNRGQSEQLDVSWQWPLFGTTPQSGVANAAAPSNTNSAGGSNSGSGCGGRWYSVGRMNYSVVDRRLVDAVAGFEYDAGCWIGRVVVERLQRGSGTTASGPESNKRLLFQLEFVGFSRLGNNPLAALQRNISRYQVLRERTDAPSRFSNYE